MVEPRFSLWVVLGTRPEAIKLAPVVNQLRQGGVVSPFLLSTGQHRDLFRGAISVFDVSTDRDLDLMKLAQSPEQFISNALAKVSLALASSGARGVLVQGDTASAFVGALAGFHAKIPVIHLEAGLRSGNQYSPFPEEMYRRMIAQLASLHLAPTRHSRDNLVREGIHDRGIVVTGNSVVTAIQRFISPASTLRERKAITRILVTLHRRETHGKPLAELLSGIRELADRHPQLQILLPVHPNPNVKESVNLFLGNHRQVALMAPLRYDEFVKLMATADLIITDSGGVQEEAPSLGIPVLIARDTTDRPESIEFGCAQLVGTDKKGLQNAVEHLLSDTSAYQQMIPRSNPFGDEQSALRCSEAIVQFLKAGNLSPKEPLRK